MSYPTTLYVRTVNPGTDEEFSLFGPSISDVSDEIVGSGDLVDPKVGRYVLAGTGEVHHTAPRYVEDTES